MHLSKRSLYFGIIAFSLTLLVLQDWPTMVGTSGTTSLAWLIKMFVDITFAGAAFVRLAGPALFNDDESDDEVAIHSEDLAFSDSALFGAFLLNIAANLGWHAFLTVTTTGAASTYYSFWVIAEGVAGFFAWILWSHAAKAQRRALRKQFPDLHTA